MTETKGVIEQKLEALGLALPPAPRPIGNYLPAVQVGNMLYVSGTLGTIRDENDQDIMPIKGKLGGELTIAQGYESAKLMALNHLALMKLVIGDLDRIERIVKMVGYVNSAPGFTEAHLVMNGASDLYLELLGPERGKHARAALFQNELGLDAPVEAEMTVLLKSE
ncbi:MULTISPECIES: RidA family protein [Pacificibacter]|uniref:RidA family protein n=1 Tax=Pacificibacter TaxID=1042323 RepID=UPI001C09B453|nr:MULTISPECIES: RidA family protein [Pacificibacter]MBU2936412.1 RidA family protein [Pacificibacter marinus]MDO6616547.1 RidA family protein [Pacificibacter sp. 1_MG-2023]